MTRDVDVAVAVATDQEAEEVVHRLLARGYGIDSVLEQATANRMATTRLLPPGSIESGIVIDLLFASSGIEGEIVDAAEPLLIFGDQIAPIATIGHLIALKLLSVSPSRPQDASDLARLTVAAKPKDLTNANQAVRLIVDRGFGRGRDLVMALDQLLVQHAPSK